MLEFNIDFGEFEKEIDASVLQGIQKVGEYILSDADLQGNFEISLSFVTEEEIRNLNRDYRQKDAVTDVLSFPMLEPDEWDDLDTLARYGPILLGDIVVCVPIAKKQSEEYRHSFLREITFLVCHSVLHLLGYDHLQEDERVLMEQKQDEIMEAVGIHRN